ncbi:polyprenyl synthetase superfamily protein [Cystoisospora suis]|uniref:Polyprenyl synthetase superfamily protein n=1 Tax=Cystoisospora suis TaxID=483139 RepID=A0A2C6L2J6_9APIC|nr:polyprenyl synthetase superfamily protein [Cystoisospora suis]
MSQTVPRHLCPTGPVSVSPRWGLYHRRLARVSVFQGKRAPCRSVEEVHTSFARDERQPCILNSHWCLDLGVVHCRRVYARTCLASFTPSCEAPPPRRLSFTFRCPSCSFCIPATSRPYSEYSISTSRTNHRHLPLSQPLSAISCSSFLYLRPFSSLKLPGVPRPRSHGYPGLLLGPASRFPQQQSLSGSSNHESCAGESTAATAVGRRTTCSDARTLSGEFVPDVTRECRSGESNDRVQWLASAWRRDAPEVQMRFEQYFVEIKNTVLGQMQHLSLPVTIERDLIAYYSKLLDYTCTGGKLTRGVLVVYAAAAARNSAAILPNSSSDFLSSPASSTPPHAEYFSRFTPSFRSLAALGWCLELLQSCFLVVDDVMDASLTRRGKPCWYRCPAVGVSNALNDSLVLEGAVYSVLRAYLRDHAAYSSFQDLLLRNIFTTLIGQHLDTNTFGSSPLLFGLESPDVHVPESATSAPAPEPVQPLGSCKPSSSPDRWSPSSSTVPTSIPTLVQMLEDRQQAIARLKTSYYSFYLPTALGMLYGGCTEPDLVAKAKHLSLAIGDYFQVQDDFLDCFSNPEKSGKIGSDIQERKCTWLLVQAAKRASREELDLLMEKYGKPGEVEWVKALYRRLGLPQVYADFEERTVSSLTKTVQEVPHDGIQAFFGLVLDRIYKREK